MMWYLQRSAAALAKSVALILCIGGLPTIAAAQSKDNPTAANSAALQEVTVTARKLIDERTLDRVIIPRFVQSHGEPNPYSHQVGRWRKPGLICPSVEGLQPGFADYVSRRIIVVAKSVGAPTAEYGHCKPNVEIIFTPNPQEQISYFDKSYRDLLGPDGESSQQLLAFNHSIRAWYTTATQSSGATWTVDSDKAPNVTGQGTTGSATGPIHWEAPFNMQQVGSASRISTGMISGFANVLVIADSKQISDHSLRSITDYVAMLVLTRTSVDGCSELPSIMDLLSPDCGERVPPDSLTEADMAYLKALYSADLEKNLNLEQGDMHRLMSEELLGK